MAQKRTPKKPPVEVVEPVVSTKPTKRASKNSADIPPTSSGTQRDEIAAMDGVPVLASLDKGRDEDGRAQIRSLWGTVAAFGGLMTRAAFDALADDESFGSEARTALTKSGLLGKKGMSLTMAPDAVAFALRSMKRSEHGFDRSMLEAALEYVLEIADEGTLTGAEPEAVEQLQEELPMVLAVGLNACADNQLPTDTIVELVATLHPHATRFPELLPLWQALPARLVIRPVAAGKSLHAWGQLELRAGHVAEARTLFKKAIDVQMRANDVVSASLVNRSLGELEEQLGNFRRAKSLFKRAIKGSGPDVRNAEGESSDGAVNVVALAKVQLKLARFAKAKRAFSSALELAEKERDDHGVAVALSGLGDACLNLGEVTEAREAFRRAEDGFLALNDPSGVAHVLASLAVADYAEGDAKGGKARLAQAKAKAKSLKESSVTEHISRIEENVAAGPA